MAGKRRGSSPDAAGLTPAQKAAKTRRERKEAAMKMTDEAAVTMLDAIIDVGMLRRITGEDEPQENTDGHYETAGDDDGKDESADDDNNSDDDDDNSAQDDDAKDESADDDATSNGDDDEESSKDDADKESADDDRRKAPSDNSNNGALVVVASTRRTGPFLEEDSDEVGAGT